MEASFHFVAERGLHFHKHLGSPGFPEAVVAGQLAAIHLPEIKNPNELDLDTHRRVPAHTCWITVSHSQGVAGTSAQPNRWTLIQNTRPREAG